MLTYVGTRHTCRRLSLNETATAFQADRVAFCKQTDFNGGPYRPLHDGGVGAGSQPMDIMRYTEAKSGHQMACGNQCDDGPYNGGLHARPRGALTRHTALTDGVLGPRDTERKQGCPEDAVASDMSCTWFRFFPVANA